MKTLVRFEEGVAIFEIGAHGVDRPGQLGKLLVGYPLGSELADHWLDGVADLNDDTVGRPVELHQQHERTAEVRTGRAQQNRTAARSRLERDDALKLEEAQRLPQGAAPGLVGLQHGLLWRQKIPWAYTTPCDIANDALGDQHRGFRRTVATRHLFSLSSNADARPTGRSRQILLSHARSWFWLTSSAHAVDAGSSVSGPSRRSLLAESSGTFACV